jgi:hypothetical protein
MKVRFLNVCMITLIDLVKFIMGLITYRTTHAAISVYIITWWSEGATLCRMSDAIATF